ncbi:P-loop containing nucleoside triphosphate hydrolase protein [Mycena floridula]|nr:P-loop containing nucleoside triphosphate hydrolase protein [Mycena floridula]
MNRPLSSLPFPPSTLSALTRAGYETTQDLENVSPNHLASALKLSLVESQGVISASQSGPSSSARNLTQSAASMAKSTRMPPLSSQWFPLDKLLTGGLSRGNIMEISGPPGAAKERIALNFVRSVVQLDEQVLFVDCQNMAPPAFLKQNIEPGSSHLVSYLSIHSLSELMVFLHNLPGYVASHPRISLVVLNSLSFPFQSTSNLPKGSRNSLLEQVKRVLARVSSAKNAIVIITSQMATRILKEDGSTGSFDSGARGVLVPQLGPGYLPVGQTFRVRVALDERDTGSIQLLSAPSVQQAKGPGRHKTESISFFISDGGELTT